MASPVFSRSITCTARGSGDSPMVSTRPARVTIPAACAACAATITSARSPGVITSAPSTRYFNTAGTCAPPTTKPSTSRSRAASPPVTTVASRAAATSATVGAATAATSGTAQAGTGRPSGRSTPSGTRLAITAETVASRSTSEWYALRAAAPRDSDVRFSPLITGTTTLPNSVARRALNASSRGSSSRPSSWCPSAKSLPITTTEALRRSTSR